MHTFWLLATLVTIAWDPNPPGDASGYLTLVWRGEAVAPVETNVGNVTQTQVDLAPGDHVAVVAYKSALVCQPQPDPAPLTCVPQLSQLLGITYFVSYPSVRVVSPTMAPDDPACQRPLGNRSIAIFLTKLQFTGSGGPGSRARVDFQLASPNSPIVRVELFANGVALVPPRIGSGFESDAGMWFTVPTASGIYPLEVRASNAAGCSATQRGTLSVTVP